MDVFHRKRPELGAGGYARDDSGVQFYLRISSLVKDSSVVLDLGAGRGALMEGAESFPLSLARLRGRVARVYGCDVDPVVMSNRFLDEARLIGADGALPFSDESFDLIFCDWVIEHVEDVNAFVSEIGRVLKPGGWFCARTPNRWGYVAVGARIVPEAMHHAVLKRVWPARQEQDVFPKFYRLNTLRAIGRAFDERAWTNCSYSCASTTTYSGGSALLYTLIDLYQYGLPKTFDTNLMVFVQKKARA